MPFIHRHRTPLLSPVVTPAALTIALSAQTPVVAGTGNVSVEPDALLLTLSIEEGSYQNQLFVQPSPLVLQLSPQTPVVTPGGIIVEPAAAVLTFASATPLLIPTAITITPAAVALLLSAVANPSVIGSGIVVTPGVLSLLFAYAIVRIKNPRPLILPTQKFRITGTSIDPATGRVEIRCEEITG